MDTLQRTVFLGYRDSFTAEEIASGSFQQKTQSRIYVEYSLRRHLTAGLKFDKLCEILELLLKEGHFAEHSALRMEFRDVTNFSIITCNPRVIQRIQNSPHKQATKIDVQTNEKPEIVKSQIVELRPATLSPDVPPEKPVIIDLTGDDEVGHVLPYCVTPHNTKQPQIADSTQELAPPAVRRILPAFRPKLRRKELFNPCNYAKNAVSDPLYPQLPFKVLHAVLCKIQRLLEDTLFDHAKINAPLILRNLEWTTSEQGELNTWWRAYGKELTKIDFGVADVHSLIDGTKHIRHAAVHRYATPNYKIELMFQAGLTILTGLEQNQKVRTMELMAVHGAFQEATMEQGSTTEKMQDLARLVGITNFSGLEVGGITGGLKRKAAHEDKENEPATKKQAVTIDLTVD